MVLNLELKDASMASCTKLPILMRFTPRLLSSEKVGRFGTHITLIGSAVLATTDCISLEVSMHGRKMPSAPDC